MKCSKFRALGEVFQLYFLEILVKWSVSLNFGEPYKFTKGRCDTLVLLISEISYKSGGCDSLWIKCLRISFGTLEDFIRIRSGSFFEMRSRGEREEPLLHRPSILPLYSEESNIIVAFPLTPNAILKHLATYYSHNSS